MREAVGNLFEVEADAVCIPVNWTTKKNGDAVMGAGVAKQAAERWPWLPKNLGRFIHGTSIRQPIIYRDLMLSVAGEGPVILCVATKWDWQGHASLPLIEANAKRLVRGADLQGWQTVALPRLGCGLKTGQLDWVTQVRPLLAELLDDRFVVVSPPASPPAPGSGSEGAGQ